MAPIRSHTCSLAELTRKRKKITQKEKEKNCHMGPFRSLTTLTCSLAELIQRQNQALTAEKRKKNCRKTL
jgi:hypothetical protein